MHLPHDAMLLRIFIGESDRWKHKPLYEAIVLKAREMHMAGATVLRGPMGFGKPSRLHTAKILRLSMGLPLVVELGISFDVILAVLIRVLPTKRLEEEAPAAGGTVAPVGAAEAATLGTFRGAGG